jgi:hypothetical protein
VGALKIAVCVPYRPSHPDRVRNFARVRAAWDAIGLPVYVGDGPPGPVWKRAHAVNAACAQARDADVLLVSDSDILLGAPAIQTVTACKAAMEHNAYVVAFTTLIYLDAGGIEFWRQTLIWGGVFAVPRSLYDEVGGFDERFQGYGSEDKGFLVCASTLGGDKQRMSGYAYHLDHPEYPLRHDEATRQGNLLAERYEAADGDKAAIRAILAER